MPVSRPPPVEEKATWTWFGEKKRAKREKNWGSPHQKFTLPHLFGVAKCISAVATPIKE